MRRTVPASEWLVVAGGRMTCEQRDGWARIRWIKSRFNSLSSLSFNVASRLVSAFGAVDCAFFNGVSVFHWGLTQGTRLDLFSNKTPLCLLLLLTTVCRSSTLFLRSRCPSGRIPSRQDAFGSCIPKSQLSTNAIFRSKDILTANWDDRDMLRGAAGIITRTRIEIVF